MLDSGYWMQPEPLKASRYLSRVQYLVSSIQYPVSFHTFVKTINKPWQKLKLTTP
jgi:hypothetical protein